MPTYKKINFIKTLNFHERSTLYQMFFADSTSKREKPTNKGCQQQ